MPSMSAIIDDLFRAELRKRGVSFVQSAEDRRYEIHLATANIKVSLDNLARQYEADHDVSLVIHFVDTVLNTGSAEPQEWGSARHSIFFCFEPSDYVERPEIKVEISENIDRVPIVFHDGGSITWISQKMIEDWSISSDQIELAASENLATALLSSTLHWDDIDSVRLAHFTSRLPFKSALLLAPNLKEFLGASVGWPVLAVMPDRDFVFVWPAKHADFAGRVGQVVLEQYATAPYPLTTEVFKIGDDGIKAIGAFSNERA
jgi:uncharacterized protein YtpQ (UPF0354 family)